MNKKKLCSIIVGMTISTSFLSQPLIANAETSQVKSIGKDNQNLSTNSEVINIPDANFKAILNQKLGQASGANITKEQLSTIKSIAARQRDIKSIDGIQYCTSLETLSLSENHISDISYLKGLTNLTILQIGSNQISDISAIKGLTKLEWLYLDDQNITLDSIYSKGNYAESNNPIKDENNNSVAPTDISNGGVYDSNTNQVKWSNVTNDVNGIYKFNKNLSIGKADFEFSGVVTQPIKYNSIPIINAKDETITVGDKFDPLAGVTAEDEEDGNLTKDIKVIKNTVNTNTSGKYEVTYEVTDKQGATGIKTITVTVNPKMEVINSAPTINAYDKTITVGDKFDPLAGVEAEDKEDGDLTKDIKVIENTVDTSKPGTYKVVYEVTDCQGAKATKTITVIVRSNDKPVIRGVGNLSIKEGDKFDPMAGVTATDTEDRNITKDIKVTGTVDVNKPGKYELTYTVTDADGNTTTVNRVVTVNLKWTNINAVPTITAENKTIKVGDKFDPLAGVTATDKEDGNITKDIKVIEDTVNTSKPGTYKVVYEVTDCQGAKVTKTITVIVRSNDKPVIRGVGNVSIKEGDKFDPMAGVTATDTEDGNITKDIKVTGTVDVNKPGKYELTYTVTDADGNTTTVNRVVIVNLKWTNINAVPTITAENKTIKVGDKFDPLAGVTATDKEDGNITKDIKVIEDTVNTSKPGTYKVVYEVTDSQGAKATKTITVIVRSNDRPVISGVGNVSIKEGEKFDPMAGVTATDTKDGNISKDIKVTGTVDVNKPGKYELTYTVTDTDGNITSVKRVVTVNPKMVIINSAPVINAKDETITVGDKFDPLAGVTAEDKEDGDLTKDIKVIKNTVDTKTPGKYEVTYEVTDKQGATGIKTITVIVNSKEDNKDTINNPNENKDTINNSNNSNESDKVKELPKTGYGDTLSYIGAIMTSLGGALVLKKKKRK